MGLRHLPGKVSEALGFYVYLYINPLDDSVFYVGKGQGDRLFSHLNDEDDSPKTRTIRAIRERGQNPRIEVLVHRLPDEETALRIEAAVIDLLGKDHLTNQVRGWGSAIVGRMAIDDLAAIYDSRPVHITESVILIRVNKTYRYGMSEQELYEVTRGVWRVSQRREQARFAFAVYRGVVREVYCIESWHAAGTTPYATRGDLDSTGRWEFVGVKADEEMRGKYINSSVADYVHRGSQNPIAYVNC